MNEGCITNLPWESVVEVPCYVDGNGISIPKVGDLPLGCAAVCSQSIWVQKLAIEAAVHGDVQLLKQAAMWVSVKWGTYINMLLYMLWGLMIISMYLFRKIQFTPLSNTI